MHVLTGRDISDFGMLLCPDRCFAHWNIWCATYEEAAKVRAETNGYLLAYKQQLLVVDSDYIRTLGLDPDAAEWQIMQRDWVKGDIKARSRLYLALILMELEMPSIDAT